MKVNEGKINVIERFSCIEIHSKQVRRYYRATGKTSHTNISYEITKIKQAEYAISR